jgi:uncharacterized protein YndB with AHSA1/START domain
MRIVEHSIEIATNPSQVIRAFTEPELLRAWWGVERALVEKRPGGLYSLVWNISDKGMGYVSTGIVQQCEPNGLFEVSDIVYFNHERAILGPMTLRVIAKVKDGKTLLNINEGGHQDGGDWDWYHSEVSASWPNAVQKLKAFLEAQ